MTERLVVRGHTFRRLGPRPVVFDLGANDGKFAAEVTATHPDARLVLVEGDPFLVSRLAERFRSRPEVLLYQGLVGAETVDQVTFHLSQIPEGSSVHPALAATWSREATRAIELPMIGINQLISRVGAPRIDLLKVDIEGSEWDVLAALGPTEAARIDQLTVEFHDFIAPEERARTEACIARLTGLGFVAECRPTAHGAGSPYFDCWFHRG